MIDSENKFGVPLNEVEKSPHSIPQYRFGVRFSSQDIDLSTVNKMVEAVEVDTSGESVKVSIRADVDGNVHKAISFFRSLDWHHTVGTSPVHVRRPLYLTVLSGCAPRTFGWKMEVRYTDKITFRHDTTSSSPLVFDVWFNIRDELQEATDWPVE